MTDRREHLFCAFWYELYIWAVIFEVWLLFKKKTKNQAGNILGTKNIKKIYYER